MKKTAVVFYSKTGSTRKVAEAIAQAAGCNPHDVKEYPMEQETELLFVGGAIYGGKIDPALVSFIEALDPKKVGRAAVFVTCASVHAMTDGKAEAQIKSALEARGIPMAAQTFQCKGRFLFLNGSCPSEVSLQEAKAFAAALTAGA